MKQLVYLSVNNTPDNIKYLPATLGHFYGQVWYHKNKLIETILNDII